MIHFTEADKQAIRKNQQKLVNILGTSRLADGYSLITDNCDYAVLEDISPIFKKLSNAISDTDDYDYDINDLVDEINEEILEFFKELPAVDVNFDLDTFNKKYQKDELYAFKEKFTDESCFDELLNCLLKSKRLTKEDKEKVLSVVCNEFVIVKTCWEDML